MSVAEKLIALDPLALRADFPILAERIHGKPLAYLDNAATAQKPQAVIDAVTEYYTHMNANVHRGVHQLSERATAAYEGAREKLARFVNAASPREVVFTRGTTEAINLVAQSFVRPKLKPGDEVLVSTMEHHSNIVPWQLVCEQTGAKLVAAPINERGELLLDEFEKLINERTRFIGIVHVSNALGTVNPVRKIIDMAHARGIAVLVDGAQAVPHARVDVQALDADFYALSGHKMYAPTGIGALIAKAEHLEAMPPWQGGGEMIRMVRFDRSIWNDIPHKFEAGTPNIAGAAGLGAAIDYLEAVGMDRIAAYEAELLDWATRRLEQVAGLRIVGTARDKAGVISFMLDGVHPHDIGTIVDTHGVAIRTGHHCAMPVMEFFNVPATARASIAFYNTREDIERLAAALEDCRRMLA
ncbi:MAG TPA: cysteine desulfurase [Gammaproteobacteria bacterium]|nr:cysteine desulfurase [Gammaproteobacteria bacterium]